MTPKDNMAYLEFYCHHSDNMPCAYFVKDRYDDNCKYNGGKFCYSLVAQANRMKITLKRMGLKNE